MSFFLKLFLLSECCLFGYGYLFGAYGMYAARRIQQQTDDLKKESNEVKNKIAMIELEIEQWQQGSFFKEQVARERLGMARKDDIVYYTE